MQRLLADVRVEGVSRDGMFKVTMNGNQEVLGVAVADGAILAKEAIERSSKEAFTDALNKVKNEMADKFKGIM